MAGVEAALIVALRLAEHRGIIWPTKVMAVLSAMLLSAGVLRHYWDIYRHRTVRGISFLFVGIDAAGDISSMVSVGTCTTSFRTWFQNFLFHLLKGILVFAPSLDVWAIVIYGVEFALWMGVFACGAYYNLIPWVTRKHGRDQSPPIEFEPQRAPVPVDRQSQNRSVPFTLHRL